MLASKSRNRVLNRIIFASILFASAVTGLTSKTLMAAAPGAIKRAGLVVTVEPTNAGRAQKLEAKRIRVNPTGSDAEFVFKLEILDGGLGKFPATVYWALEKAPANELNQALSPKPGRLVEQVRVELADGTTESQDLIVTVVAKIPDQADPNNESKATQVYYDDRVRVVIDKTPPQIVTVKADRGPYDAINVQIPLKEADFDAKSLESDALKVYFSAEDNANVCPLSATPTWNPVTRSIEFEFQGKGLGKYLLKLPTLQDDLGNSLTVGLDREIEIKEGPTAARRGTHVEFPEFVTRDTRDIRDFNAFDRVTTRVVRLYYERDAYKVVKTINRNVEELNRSGASFAQDLANKLQDRAVEATTVRRNQEQQAIQEVQRAREARKGIERAQKQLQRNQTVLSDLRIQKSKLDNSADPLSQQALGTNIADQKTTVASSNQALTDANNLPADNTGVRQKAIDDAQKKLDTDQNILNNLTARRNAEIDRLSKQQDFQDQIGVVQENIDAANRQVESYNAQLADAQQKESMNTLGVLNAQETEDQARVRQFRQEVVAGLTDRDIYAAADTTSKDPVTQVSMSVIGEGTIHLRGPAKGINKIARIIHQMDSPVGQVKLGIQTVQINGEHGDRMEFVYERIDKHIAQARFLTHESTQLFRKAVQEVASEIAVQVDHNYIPPDMTEFDDECAALTGADQRHWRYVNAFFGGDFIRELREMDSELLKHNNKLLSLHSMDSISLASALYVTAIAKHSVRQSIIERFKSMVVNELPMKEIDYYRALTRIRCPEPHINHLIVAHFGKKLDVKDAKMIWEKAIRTYQFTNFIGFFDAQLSGEDTLNNVQFATLRLAQALKAQLVSELELRNLVLERSLIEMRPDENFDNLNASKAASEKAREQIEIDQNELAQNRNNLFRMIVGNLGKTLETDVTGDSFEVQAYRRAVLGIQNDRADVIDYVISMMQSNGRTGDSLSLAVKIVKGIHEKFITPKLRPLGLELNSPQIQGGHELIKQAAINQICEQFPEILATVDQERVVSRRLAAFRRKIESGEKEYETARQKHAAIRVLDAAIDETEEKAVELLEAMRSHVANVDNYLKRLAISFEDDVNAQFYNPAMMDVRRASRYWDVNLSQVENTTVLTNNRALAKVSPSATMEFDLPARDILLVEALKGSKALAQEYGNLLKDPTFIAGVGLVGGRVPVGPSQSPVNGIIDPTLGLGQEPPQVGAALTSLIPQPAVYKFETGTALEIRPVIQPDGHSIVYRFDYMYTTNVREPVRADEKHLGRVKRHFTSTDVQTSSYEMREITRYSVALKASRTSRGVPLLEDIPALGWIFRPLPNQESSLQQNIILGTSTIYPTLFDLMGLRWSPYADQIDSRDLADRKKREREITRRYRSNLLNKARAFVREEIGGDLELPPDLPGDYVEPPPAAEYIPAGPVSNRDLRGRDDGGGQGVVEEEIELGNPANLVPSPSARMPGRPNATRLATDPRETGRTRPQSPPPSPAPRRPAGQVNPNPTRPALKTAEPPRLNPPDNSRVKRPSPIQQASYIEAEPDEEAGFSTTGRSTVEPPRQIEVDPNAKPASDKPTTKPSFWPRIYKR